MRNRCSKEYNALLCVKINLFTAIILFILFVCSKLLTEKIQNNALATVHDLGVDNGAGAIFDDTTQRYSTIGRFFNSEDRVFPLNGHLKE